MPDLLESTDTGLMDVKDAPQAPESKSYARIDAVVESAIKKSHSLEELLIIIDQKTGELKGSSDIDIAQLQRDIDFVVNFLLLDKEMLMGVQDPSVYAREASARVQHQLIHRIYYASSPEASTEYVDTTYKVARNTAARIDRIDRGSFSQLNRCWQGTRNQLAVERVLIGGGFEVFQPDYSQDPAEVDDEDNEVLQLDVKEGVDLIAIAPRVKPNLPRSIILLDVKGRNWKQGITEPVLKNVLKVRSPGTLPNHCLRKAIFAAAHRSGETDLSQVFRAQLFIPSGEESFEPNTLATREFRYTAQKQEELRNFGRLQPSVARMTLNEARSIETYR